MRRALVALGLAPWLCLACPGCSSCADEPSAAMGAANARDGDGDGDGGGRSGDGGEDEARTSAGSDASERKRDCLDALMARDDLEGRFVAMLRALCGESINREIPGVAVAVVERGGEGEPPRMVMHFERGVSCFGEDAPVDASTRFRLGSISKVLTAALVLGFVDEREGFALETRVGASGLIPGLVLPPGIRDPSVEALLGQRAGLGPIEPEQVVADDGDWRRALTAAPQREGEHSYVNANYVVLGAMLEGLAGSDYGQLVRARLAGPLGLSTLGADAEVAVAEGAACGHLEEDPDRHPILVSEDLDFMPGDPSWLRPTGGVLADAEDLGRFALAIGGPELPGSAAMLEPGAPVLERSGEPRRYDERYGLGLRAWTLPSGRLVYGHSGDNGSFRAELLFVPGQRAVVILANRGGELAVTRAAALELLDEP
ncbi:beta-lactamase family protein [Pseudenhygromyxa sp. WMMC2535]|uniref:serine hydrolase domain-containing protein n=1 Tax=Pseudenhygromyxa sp. WMMC2535 TaxID=2712867 RepID=UPI001553163F|nr:serine hydrolase domain-containing protein [Pseudenhygromyxa sp. WMMC2535]NVB36697.1 beta-lactamase family protein [Pseudenhygromyxa sp. WMMC2535]